MKRTSYYLAAAAVLALALCAPGAADAATVDINGRVLDLADADSGVMQMGSTTMVSEDVLAQDLYMTVTRDGKAYTLTNAFGDFTISGKVGEDSMLVDGDMMFALPTAAAEKDGVLYLPLRAVAEQFGTVHWYGDRGQTLVRVDYNSISRLPEATRDSEPVRGTPVMDAGFSAPDGTLVYDDDEHGHLLYKLDDKGYATALGYYGEKNLITVQHEGYHLHWVDVDENFVYWWEVPLASGVKTSYLYIQPRDGETAPTLVTESDNVASEGGMHTFGSFTAAANGSVIWALENADKSAVEVWLYTLASDINATKLDSLPLDAGSVNAQVALNDKACAWTTSRSMKVQLAQNKDDGDLNGSYGDLKLYDLATGKTRNISQGYNLQAPQLIGDYLVTSSMVNEDDLAPNDACYWVYDLAQGAWRYRVTQDMLGLEGESNIYLGDVAPLDATHAALDASYLGKPYQLSVLDLAAAKVHPVVNRTGEPLFYTSEILYDASLIPEQGVIKALRPIGKWGESLSTLQLAYNGEIRETYWPVKFEW